MEGLVARSPDGIAEWQANAPGTLRVHCAKEDVKLAAVPLARVVIESNPPLRIRERTLSSLRARGEDTSGHPIELWSLHDDQLHWSAPVNVSLRQPRCGHMAALCIGAVGNGYLMDAELQGDVPATVSLRVGGIEGQVVLPPAPPDPP